jgi:hypothetical protein
MTPQRPQFLNVDLDIESRERLDRLADALDSLTVMFASRTRGKHVLSLEGPWAALSLDETLRRLAKLISSLSGEPRRLWHRASRRTFNIGLACGSRRAPPFPIRSSTIEAIAAIAGSIEVTLYPHDESNPRNPRSPSRSPRSAP